MSDKPEQSRFSPAQLALAGLCAALVLVVLVIAVSVWSSASG
jgi:uncharacterized OsmC-like protein